MLARKFPWRDDLLRFGSSGDEVRMRPEYLNYLFFSAMANELPPSSCLPLRQTRRHRLAILAGRRVFEGFAWHNACYPLVPSLWQDILRLARPDYLLVESCLYDSARAWPLDCFRPDYPARMRLITETATRMGIPSIFWYTLGSDLLPRFIEGMRGFDIVACADSQLMDILQAHGLQPRYFPWAFSPEQFNPLKNTGRPPHGAMLLFNGISDMIRFEHVRDLLEKLDIPELAIIDSSMLVPEYNLHHFPDKRLLAHVKGCVSQTFLQDWYKNATALLTISDPGGSLTPAQQWRALEAAACHVPVLHYGKNRHQFLDNFSEFFADIKNLRTRYEELRASFIELEIAGHLAWRRAHRSFTFAHRMDEMESWLGLGSRTEAMASVIVPSMRPQNYAHAIAQYSGQNYANKELIYVYNGAWESMPQTSGDATHISHVPSEYTTGMAMNAGARAAHGDIIFRFDDDDMYGPDYIADRMTYFREFPIDILCNSRFFVNFVGSDQAWLIGQQDGTEDHTAFPLGAASYAMHKYSGGSVAMRRAFALTVGFQEQAYAHADVSLLMKGILFAPQAIFLKTDWLNFCVRRNDASRHTWMATRDEIMAGGIPCPVSLASIFI